MKHNPFSTRKTTPGKIPWHFGDDSLRDDPIINDFYEKFRNFDYRSQITGGHGTGKTTFLYEFVRYLECQKHIVNHFTLHDGQRSFPLKFWERQNLLASQFLYGAMKEIPITVVDGYEQLALAQKIRLRRACRKGKCGLLITTHRPAWRLPVLRHTETTDATLQHIIRYLFRDLPDMEPPNENLCRTLFDRHQGNLRNVLFDLYDYYEQ